MNDILNLINSSKPNMSINLAKNKIVIKEYTKLYIKERKEISNQEFVAVVLDYNKETKLAKMEQRNNFKVNDKIEIFGPENKNVKLTVKEMYDENMQKITVAPHPQQIIYVKTDEEVYKNNLVRKLLDKGE